MPGSARLAGITRLREPLGALSGRGWVVGGGLRDALLGRPVDDVDIAFPGDAREPARDLARAHGAGRFRLSAEFGAWRVHGGRLPFTVDITPLQGETLEEDLSRRDFTVNALALPLVPGEAMIDLHGGRADLEARRMRLVTATALRADPVRVMRLARLARSLGFEVSADARSEARAAAGSLMASAPERLIDELGRILALPEAWRGVDLLDDLGALTALIPELEKGRGMEQNPFHHKDVLGHILEVVRHADELAVDPEPVFRSLAPRVSEWLAQPLADEMSRAQGLLMAGLFHDVAKPATKAVTPEGRVTFIGHDELGARMADEWFRAMHTSTRMREHVMLMVRRHLPLGFMVHRQPLSLRQIDRYLRLTAPAEIDLLVLSVADRLATAGPRTKESAISRHLALAREVMQIHFRILDRGPIRPLVDGAEIANALKHPPGPWLTQVLEALREEQLVGAVRDRAAAVDFCRNWADRFLK
jgi:poly(A) polymerase